MTDAELLAEIKSAWAHWSEHLGLQNWWVYFQHKPKQDAFMSVATNHTEYHRVGFYWRQPKPSELKPLPWPISRYVLHEALHVPLERTADVAYKYMGNAGFKEYRDHAEVVCDEMTAIIFRLHEACHVPDMGMTEGPCT